MIQRTYKVREQHSLGRWFAIEESDQPNCINLVVHDPDEHRTQRVTIQRDDWKELNRITGEYSREWSWAGSPKEEDNPDVD